MITIREIHDLYEQRKKRLTPGRQAALNVQRAYYGEIVLPLPELDKAEKPLVANLLLSGGEQRALRGLVHDAVRVRPIDEPRPASRGQASKATSVGTRRLVG